MSSNDEELSLAKTKAALDKVSSSFCLAKWTQATNDLFNGNTRSCHHVRGHKTNLTELAKNPAGLHNTRRKKRARAQMLAGQRPKECSYCWKIEDKGGISDRIYKSRESWSFPDLQKILDEGADTKSPPRYLEVAFDNICNFKCVYCSPVYSTSWHAEIKSYGPYPTTTRYNNLWLFKFSGLLSQPESKQQKRREAFWNWWPQLKEELYELRVTGGEPLLSKDTWKLFEELKQKKHERLNFSINSNFGVPPHLMQRLSENLNQLAPKVKSITVHTSLDTTGKAAEYIRYGLVEEEFWRNIHLLLNNARFPICLSFMITVNALSLVGLEALMERIAELRRKYPRHHVAFDTPYLKNPRYLSIQILPKSYVSYIEKAKKSLQSSNLFSDDEIYKLSRLESLLTHNEWASWKVKWLKRDFYRMFVEYDRRRKLDFLKTFPEMRSFWGECEGIAKKWPLSLF